MKFTAAVLGLVASSAHASQMRIILNYEGAGNPVGSLDDVNDMLGTTVTVEQAFPDVTLGDFIACFEVPMVDLETKAALGTGIDCLWGMTGGVAAIAFYNFECGVLVNHGFTSTGPFTEGVGDGPIFEGSPIPNTLTGSLPADDSNSILEGTGDFVGATGGVRLSGAVHLSASGAAFDCIWDIFIDVENTPTCGLPATPTSSEIFTEDAAVSTGRGVGSSGRGVVQFLGLSENVGTLADVGEDLGFSLTVEDLGFSLTVEDALGHLLDEIPSEFFDCNKMPLVDFITKDRIGDGYDCLWPITGGVAAVGIYDFGNGDIIVNSGLTSLAPFTEGLGDGPIVPGSPNAVVMSGSLPPALDSNTFLVTTGKFEGWKGNIRLSGAAIPPEGENSFWFSCIWEVTITEIPPAATSPPSGAVSKATTFFGAAALALFSFLMI